MSKGNKSSFKGIIDTDGLHALSSVSANLRAAIVGHLSSGVLAVSVAALKEFREIYPDEAELLEDGIAIKIKSKKDYNYAQASICSKLNSGFYLNPYDEQVDIFTGAVSIAHDCKVVTVSKNIRHYTKMKCKALDLSDWVEEQEE